MFLLDSNEKVSSEDDLIFYNNPEHVSGYAHHLGIPNEQDNVEMIKIDLSKIPSQVEKLKIITSIYEAESRNQNFSMIQGAYLILDDLDSKKKLRRIDFDPQNSGHTIEVGEIYRFSGVWRFRETWNSYRAGLATACEKFGIQTEQPELIAFDDSEPIVSSFKEPENISAPKNFEEMARQLFRR